MSFRRIVNGLAAVEFLCCKILKILQRFDSSIARTGTTEEKSALAALKAAAELYCALRQPDPE
jgi:hypothetical protein